MLALIKKSFETYWIDIRKQFIVVLISDATKTILLINEVSIGCAF